jgi:hypothetical protein
MLATAFFESGVYAELSHATAHIALKANPPVVCAIHAAQVLGKSMTFEKDGLHYTRQITGGPLVTKIMIGKPKGIPTTSFKNPACETAGSKPSAKESAKPARTLEDIMDEVCDAECRLPFWTEGDDSYDSTTGMTKHAGYNEALEGEAADPNWADHEKLQRSAPTSARRNYHKLMALALKLRAAGDFNRANANAVQAASKAKTLGLGAQYTDSADELARVSHAAWKATHA